ncbi:hypothetical protein [Streptomyces sp. MJM8645]|uniref:hypothetical protein n=1 Tax=Streptomyces sp. MJM8645 TaxID=1120523 RepID=UPI0007AF2D39|nr:hypothetical protein [Streptomyces sp. MJM8645]
MAKAKRKAENTAALFRRTESQWEQILGHDRGAAFFAALPTAGIGALIERGAATPAELDMIRAVAAGQTDHEHLTAEHAARILADMPAD